METKSGNRIGKASHDSHGVKMDYTTVQMQLNIYIHKHILLYCLIVYVRKHRSGRQ